MSKNPRDKNRLPGQNDGDEEEMENMPQDVKGMDPKKGEKGGQSQQSQHGKPGQQSWNQRRKGEHSVQPRKGDEMNRPKDTDENMDDRKRRPA